MIEFEKTPSMNVIDEIAKIENTLFSEANNVYGNYYTNCLKLFEALRKIKSTHDKGFVFNLFWSQLVSLCSLYILSLIRKHTLQSNMLLRPIYETICHTSYAMHETDIEKYGEIENGILVPSKSIKNNIYNWLKKEFDNYSEFIQKKKDALNKLFLHASVFSALMHIKDFPAENKFRGLWFDDVDNVFTTEAQLVGFSNQLYHFIIMTIDVNYKYGLLEFDENYEKEVESLHQETKLLMQEVLLKSEGIREFIDKDI